MSNNQMTTPLLCTNQSAVLLEAVKFDESREEKWLQQQLRDFPQLIPIAEIEPLYAGLFCLGEELRSEAGIIDLLYVNASGCLTLVETKLWRNRDARREVLGQVIEYAKELSSWSYEKLFEAVKAANPAFSQKAMFERFRTVDIDFDESRFHDAITRNLRLGKLLLLIVGDGIREGMEQMVEYLNRTPHLHFNLSLVAMAIYRVPNSQPEQLLIQPRIIARTVEITRAVVVVSSVGPASISVSTPDIDDNSLTPRQKLSEEAFVELLIARADSETLDGLRWILKNAPAHRLRLYWGKETVGLFYDDPSGYKFSFGRISSKEQSVCIYLHEHCLKLNLPDEIWKDYYSAVQSIVPQAQSKTEIGKDGIAYVYLALPDGSNLPLPQLARSKEAWFAAIDLAVEKIASALSDR